ncbi:unnamed protein product [[Actinomadura] parvosata subsp. kistnae]|nr:unnamed protein product [Actinomadura parvosata subsp. kistnae]
MAEAAVEQAFREGPAVSVAVANEGANPASSQLRAGAADARAA